MFSSFSERFLMAFEVCSVVVLCVSVHTLNMVTAVIVNDIISGAMKDKQALAQAEERKHKQSLRQLSALFYKLDAQGSGMVGANEMLNLDFNELQKLAEMTGISDPRELFRMIDLEDIGQLDIDEFCEGLWQMIVDKVPVETRRMQKRIELVTEQVRLVRSANSCLVEAVGELVACQRTFLDSWHCPNQLGSTVASMEKMLKELNQPIKLGKKSKDPKSPPGKRNRDHRITGVNVDEFTKSQGTASLRNLGEASDAGRDSCKADDSRSVTEFTAHLRGAPPWAQDMMDELKAMSTFFRLDQHLGSRSSLGSQGTVAGRREGSLRERRGVALDPVQTREAYQPDNTLEANRGVESLGPESLSLMFKESECVVSDAKLPSDPSESATLRPVAF
eukprot:TRINITY_DN29497_c0_g1_i2.p1 TRINITY_DN29497_c0_g1~~TRINITY_DN29497_c0_g1_i2.p1  ORF type:complete len:391 (-),score=70.05 TRINITY_DN29497_c0_g1_i2:212-1384(-)